MSTKNIISKEKRNLDTLIGHVQQHCLSIRTCLLPAGECNEWHDLYFAHPTSNQADGYLRRFNLLIRVRPDYYSNELRDKVEAVATKCLEIEALKAQLEAEKAAGKAAKIERASSNGSYSYNRNFTKIEDRLSIRVGDILLLNYGLGTQPAFVIGASHKRLLIQRLKSRGTKYAHWCKGTSISRNCPRILGFHKLSHGDPAPSFPRP